jgi:hypothetical protein
MAAVELTGNGFFAVFFTNQGQGGASKCSRMVLAAAMERTGLGSVFLGRRATVP